MTLYISVIKPRGGRQARKTMTAYLAAAAFCLVFDRVYALFGHGVRSVAMDWMVLYPLIGGALVFAILWLFVPQADRVRHYRILYNAYNSGVAALTTGSLLTGIFEIAGTSSAYTAAFMVAGGLLCAAGVLGYLLNYSRGIAL